MVTALRHRKRDRRRPTADPPPNLTTIQDDRRVGEARTHGEVGRRGPSSDPIAIGFACTDPRRLSPIQKEHILVKGEERELNPRAPSSRSKSSSFDLPTTTPLNHFSARQLSVSESSRRHEILLAESNEMTSSLLSNLRPLCTVTRYADPDQLPGNQAILAPVEVILPLT